MDKDDLSRAYAAGRETYLHGGESDPHKAAQQYYCPFTEQDMCLEFVSGWIDAQIDDTVAEWEAEAED